MILIDTDSIISYHLYSLDAWCTTCETKFSRYCYGDEDVLYNPHITVLWLISYATFVAIVIKVKAKAVYNTGHRNVEMACTCVCWMCLGEIFDKQTHQHSSGRMVLEKVGWFQLILVAPHSSLVRRPVWPDWPSNWATLGLKNGRFLSKMSGHTGLVLVSD